MRRYFLAALCSVLALSACEGSRNNTSWSHRKDGTAIVPPLTKAADSTKAKADTTKAASAPADTSQHKH